MVTTSVSATSVGSVEPAVLDKLSDPGTSCVQGNDAGGSVPAWARGGEHVPAVRPVPGGERRALASLLGSRDTPGPWQVARRGRGPCNVVPRHPIDAGPRGWRIKRDQHLLVFGFVRTLCAGSWGEYRDYSTSMMSVRMACGQLRLLAGRLEQAFRIV